MTDWMTGVIDWIDNWQLMTAFQQYISRYLMDGTDLYKLVFDELIDNRVEYHKYLKKIHLNDVSIRRYYEDRVYVGKKLEFPYNRMIVNEMMIIRKNIKYDISRHMIINGKITDSVIAPQVKAFVLDGYESMMTVIKTRIQKFIQESRIIDDFFKKNTQKKQIIPDKEKVLIKSMLTSLFYSTKMKFISENAHLMNELMDEHDKSILMMDISTYHFNEYFTHYLIGIDLINIDMMINIYEDEWKNLRIYSIDRIE